MQSASVNSASIVPPAPVGFVGLGKMGYPMACRLSGAGYRIVAHDLDPNALRRARDAAGAEAPGSLKAMASRCEAVITMLPDGEAVRAVVLGPGEGSAAVTYADGRLYFRYQDGLMALIETMMQGWLATIKLRTYNEVQVTPVVRRSLRP